MKPERSARYQSVGKKKKIIYNIIFYIAGAIFIISVCMLIKILVIDPASNNKLNDQIKDLYYEAVDGRSALEKILPLNSDIKGWIKIENTDIDYPVLYSDYYIRRDYNKNYSRFGSIFLDNSCKIEEDPQNILIHGHNMRDGSMFAKICNYTDLEFYKSTPTFTFDTVLSPGKWKIISVFKTNTSSEHGPVFYYLQSKFSSPSEFLEYVYKVKVRSIINTPVDISKNDKFVLLSTCSYELPDFRTVVVARKVRENESAYVDTSLATYNSQPLMPDAYYQKFGGSKPNVSTFKDDLSKGKISWYKEY